MTQQPREWCRVVQDALLQEFVHEAVTTLPPVVIADLFGIGAPTAETRAKYADGSWTRCLAARA